MFGIDDLAAASIIGTVGNIAGDLVSQSNARSAFKSRYQDTVADMRKAGLNPALAYGQGGGNPQTSDMGDWSTSAAQIATAIAGAKQAKAQTEKTSAEANLIKAQTAGMLENLRLRNELLTPTINNARVIANLNTESYNLRKMERERQEATQGEDINSRLSAARQVQLMEPEARARAKYYRGLGKYQPYISTATDVIRALTPLITGMPNITIPSGPTIPGYQP